MSAAAARRRRALARRIKDGLVVLATAPVAAQSRDVSYFPYVPDNYFFYLSGCAAPHCALILSVVGGGIRREVFFCRPFDAQTVRWNGPYLNTRTAKKQTGFAEVADIAELDAHIAKMVRSHKAFYYLPGNNARLDAAAKDSACRRRAENRAGARGPGAFADVAALLDEMRLIKDAEEIAAIEAACALTAAAITEAMHIAPTVRRENELEAALIHRYRRGNAQHAFPPIVAAGKRACFLHYTANNAICRKNELVLIDTGCRLAGYAGDITRTFPLSGEWQPAARAVYDVVLAAQRAAIAKAKPGNRWQSVENTATRELCAGIRALGLSRARTATLLRQRTYQRFYMHRVGHWLGLDVHDVGSADDTDGRSRRLRAGMVCTIEPGLYLPDEPDIPQPLRGIGVRIEDDIVITKTGNRVLTAAAPKTRAQISAAVGAGK